MTQRRGTMGSWRSPAAVCFRGPGLVMLLGALWQTFCTLGSTTRLRVVFPPAVTEVVTTVELRHTGRGCAEKLHETVASVLRQRGVSVDPPDGARPEAGSRAPDLRIAVLEAACGEGGGPPVRPESPGERTAWTEGDQGDIYPGRPIPPRTTAPGASYRLDAVVQVTDTSTGQDAGRLDLQLDRMGGAAPGDGNLPGRARSGESVVFAEAEREIERFFFGWEESLRLGGPESVDCGPIGVHAGQPLDGERDPGRALLHAFAVVGACRGLRATQSDGRLASALYNLGLSALLSGVPALAHASFEEAWALSPDEPRYRRAVREAHRIQRLGGRIEAE